MNIFCFMTSGVQITDLVSDVLYRSAIQMVHAGQKRRRITHDDVQGFISTDYESALIGTVPGYIFNADVAVKAGTTKVKFLVREGDLGEAEVARWVPVYRVTTKKRSKNEPSDN